jgi:hypothetical protein
MSRYVCTNARAYVSNVNAVIFSSQDKAQWLNCNPSCAGGIDKRLKKVSSYLKNNTQQKGLEVWLK